MKRKRSILITIVLLFLIGGSVIYLWPKIKGKPTKDSFSEGRIQNTVTAKIGTIATYLSSSGTLEPLNNVTVSSTISGEIVTLYKQKGDVVKKGDLLASISKEQAEIDYLVAKKEYESAKIDGDDLNIRQKDLQLKKARDFLAQTEIKAPSDGTVIDVLVAGGDQVGNGTGIMQIVDLTSYKVNLRINESDISSVEEDQPVRIVVGSLGNRTFPGVISDIGFLPTGQGDPVTYPVQVSLTVKDSDLKPGMNCTVDITTAIESDTVIIPVESVNRQGNKAFVTVISDNDVKSKEVHLGLSDGLNVAVIEGLEPGTTLVRTNYALYLDAVSESEPSQPGERRESTPIMPNISIRPSGGGRF